MELLCMMKEIQRAMNAFEEELMSSHHVCLNEALILCSLENESLSASEISDKTGLSNSNASKVIRCIEEKELIKRVLGKKDKRQMYFKLSEQGKIKLNKIKSENLKIPVIFESIVNKCSHE